MKKVLLFCGVAALAQISQAQCSDIFFSKYLSNGSNNKALEIYNPTANPIVLNGTYYIARYKTPTASGNTSGPVPSTISSPADGDTLWLKGTIQPYSTFVVANPEVTPNSSNSNAVDDPRIRAKAAAPNGMLGNIYGTYGSTTGDPTYFKGSDALTIEKKVGTTITIVDLFGRQGDLMVASNNKPSAWSTIAPYTGGTGMGWWITKGYMMERKSSIKQGVTSNPSAFNPLADWDTIAKPHTPADTAALYNRLGSHQCDCKPLGVNEISKSIVSSVYPNPVVDGGKLTVNSSEMIKSYMVTSVSGAVVKEEELTQTKNSFSINVDQMPKGVYFVSLRHTNGLTSLTRFIKN